MEGRRQGLRAAWHGALVLTTVALLAGCSQARETAQDVEEETEEVADNLPGVGEETLQASLTGSTEVPGPGDPDGSGDADVTIDLEDGEVCYDIDVSNVATITAAHIHEGAAGASGGPVVNFQVDQNGLEGCVTDVSRDLLQNILSNPSGYYVNVHNADFPAGALRGQLRD